MDGFFTVKVHHGGQIERNEQLEYVGGEINFWDNCDIDRWSWFELKEGTTEFGYRKNYDMWYANPNDPLEDALRPIIDDKEAIKMAQLGEAVGVVDLYLLHNPLEFNETLVLPSSEPREEESSDDKEKGITNDEEKEFSDEEIQEVPKRPPMRLSDDDCVLDKREGNDSGNNGRKDKRHGDKEDDSNSDS